ncbi:hypothetical protein FHX64_002927 [Microbacter margulisiae]|uniref:Uncharacterized protein n=1 Tax=Microbacter margulisiae TaxID=1350067 RepID=A0A7W5DTC9_9PORP|nr:hypothetical protein [Microbacter margulisiae]
MRVETNENKTVYPEIIIYGYLFDYQYIKRGKIYINNKIFSLFLLILSN